MNPFTSVLSLEVKGGGTCLELLPLCKGQLNLQYLYSTNQNPWNETPQKTQSLYKYYTCAHSSSDNSFE